MAWASWEAGRPADAGVIVCTPAERLSALKQLVAGKAPTCQTVRLVLSPNQYQVFQLERPEGVDESELADALRWKLRDLIDFSASDAVCDVFPFPSDASRGRGELVNVVVARQDRLAGYVSLVHDAGLDLESIDIAHLALRNAAEALDADERGLALVHLREDAGQMVICRGATLYLSRRLDVVADHLSDAARQDDAIQSLALEMQRSLDYFESQLGQAPPRTVVIAGQDPAMPLAPMLSPYVGVGVEALDPERLAAPRDLDARCLPALGVVCPAGASV
ncbi:type IV pilus biogenesis protein PilM [Tamilnaduibacter salinus]|uniref:biogenesis protein MshI n=1 Tax=Tamilnaduibacter salinus TaxID=1484056 RepID=UPI001D1765CA|nr:biogenesis protein MshI [Tamilnaduibacter salinus]